jgi:hypothetical protein
MDTPQPMWREVVGDTEPWRRGRLFLVFLAIWQLATGCVGLGALVLAGRIELVLAASFSALIFWLLFYFIWIGVHWVRWVTGGFMALVGFANLIWGLRDGAPARILDGTIGFPLAAYLALAPSVYFFAIRQKETIRWKESLVVAAVFMLLLASLFTTMVGLFSYKTHLQQGATAFADRAFRSVFVDHDGDFLRTHSTDRAMRERGIDRLNWFMQDTSSRLGETRILQPSRGRVQFRYDFPASLMAHGVMSAPAQSEEGPVWLDIGLVQARGGWQIDSLRWTYAPLPTFPHE